MSLPRFFDRVADAALPLLPAAGREELRERLEATTLALSFRAADDLRSGFLLAVNLATRLYPTLVFEAPDDLAAEATALAEAINPVVSLGGEPTHRLAFAPAPTDGDTVTVSAAGWNVIVDGARETATAAPPAALAAAAVGLAEIFRAVFSDWLERGRTDTEPGSFNLVTLEEWSDVPVPERYELGRVHLAGAGAIGEATVLTLSSVRAAGELVVVDPEHIELSNLQRYVLTRDPDEGAEKTALAARELRDSDLNVIEAGCYWGADERSAAGQEVVLAALDSSVDRIGVQAGLHHRVYNAYTQPTDIGWSRHERFGVDPCLACLYWPRKARPNLNELVAEALDQPLMRVRTYLAAKTPVGEPLKPPLPQADVPPTDEEVMHWLTTPLIQDIAPRYGLDGAAIGAWSVRTLDDLYRKGICGGGLVRVDGTGATVLVPLAHQSALAGVMLATQALAASHDQLRLLRPAALEGRYDVRRRLPKTLTAEPTRRPGCICDDGDFRDAYERRWLS